jgi:hypothetical protein
MAADMQLAMDKVVVNAQWHVHGYGNISSIIQQCMDIRYHTNKIKTSKNYRKCHLFYIYLHHLQRKRRTLDYC